MGRPLCVTLGAVNMRAIIVVLLLPAVVLLTSGCQPGGPPPPEAYERLANAICINNSATLAGIKAEVQDPDTPNDRKASLRIAMTQVHKKELNTLKQLEPPDAVRARADEMYGIYGTILLMLDGKSAGRDSSMSITEATMLLNEKMRSLALADCARTAADSYPGLETVS